MKNLLRILLATTTLLLSTHIQSSEVKNYDHIKLFISESLQQNPRANASGIFE